MGAITSTAAEPKARLPKKHLTLLRDYCFDCHDADIQKGKVNLEALPLEVTTPQQAELWQKVLNAMNSGEMPPEEKPQPKDSEKIEFLDALAQTMITARRKFSDTGGKITMRRLNRREYRNSIKQLTGVTLDVSNLPVDDGAGNFDTVGSALFISSDQIEQYLSLGRSAIAEMLERRAALERSSQVFHVEPEKTVNIESLKAMRRLEDDYERFKQWKVGVDKASRAPENRKIMARILKENPEYDPLAFPAPAGYRFYRHAKELIGAPDPKVFGFTDDNKAVFSFQGGYDRKYAYLKHYAELPKSSHGTYLKLAWGIQRIDVVPDPKNVPPGTYKLRIRAGTVEGSSASRHFLEIGHPQRVNQVPAGFSGLPFRSLHVTGTENQPEIIETTIEIGIDNPREFGIQERQPNDGKHLRNEFFRYKRMNGYGYPPAIWIDWIELEGPIVDAESTSVQDNWWIATASNLNDSSRARIILNRLAQNAFRGREPTDGFLERLHAIYQTRRDEGWSFENAIELPLGIILTSPAFLYLNEPGSETMQRKLNDRELAVRLAYFLWSAPPDQQLMELAKQNQLSKPEVLRQQVDRLIADSRSDQFVSGFVHQWLDMERLDFFQFDASLHPEFDEITRSAARQEVYHAFGHLLRDKNGGEIGELLRSDYVFVNALLANFYGISGVIGDQFQKVRLPNTSPRGGLLGMAAIHAMGSDGIRSSPVERGAWILRHLLHNPPPPAPPNVPQLSDLSDKLLSTRQKLAAHQSEPQCASCHRKIDPLGLALENFNAAGKWRIEDRQIIRNAKGRIQLSKTAVSIDTSGRFHKGPEFADFKVFRDIIAQRETDFARGFCENLIEYALGRPYGFTDERLANKILEGASRKQYAVDEFIHGLVQSKVFQTK